MRSAGCALDEERGNCCAVAAGGGGDHAGVVLGELKPLGSLRGISWGRMASMWSRDSG